MASLPKVLFQPNTTGLYGTLDYRGLIDRKPKVLDTRRYVLRGNAYASLIFDKVSTCRLLAGSVVTCSQKGEPKEAIHGADRSEPRDQSVNQEEKDNYLQDNPTARRCRKSTTDGLRPCGRTTSKFTKHGRKHSGSRVDPCDLHLKTSDHILGSRSCGYSAGRPSRHQDLLPS